MEDNGYDLMPETERNNGNSDPPYFSGGDNSRMVFDEIDFVLRRASEEDRSRRR